MIYSRKENYFSNEENVFSLLAYADKILHCHDFIEIFYIDSGSGRHFVGKEQFDFVKGDLFIVNINTPHRYIANKTNNPKDRLVIYNVIFAKELFMDERHLEEDFFAWFSKKYLNADIKDYNEYFYINSKNAYMFKPLMRNVFDEIKKKNVGWHSIVKGNIVQLLTNVLRFDLGFNDSDLHIEHSQLIETITTLIEENFRYIKINDISEKVFFSPQYLNKLFKNSTGMTITQYIAEYKLKVASSLIATTDLSVEKIIEEIGGRDRKRFYEFFKRKFGMSPGEIRARSK